MTIATLQFLILYPQSKSWYGEDTPVSEWGLTSQRDCIKKEKKTFHFMPQQRSNPTFLIYISQKNAHFSLQVTLG